MNLRRNGYSLKGIILIFIGISESLAYEQDFSDNMIKMKVSKDKILHGYDKTIPPSKSGKNATLVAVGLVPRQIMEVDEVRGLFELDSLLSIAWEDPRLTWNVSTGYDGIIELPVESLWVPNIIISNSHSMQINPGGKANLAVIAEGFVTWFPSLHTKTSCPSLTRPVIRPDEVVTCYINIASWVHEGWEIDVVRDEHLNLRRFANINPRWELLITEAKVIPKVTVKGHMYLNTVFPIKRRTLPEIEVTKKLCILVMLLTLSIFWLPPNSSKKVLLGGILLLILTKVLMYVALTTQYPLTALFAVSFLQSTMCIVVFTLLLQVLVIFNICKITGPARPPVAVMRLLNGPVGKIVCLRSSLDVNNNIPIDVIQLHENPSNTPVPPTPRDDWMLLAAGLDRLFFIFMSFAIISIHL